MDALTYLLCKGAEEAAEVGHAFSKSAVFGITDYHPKRERNNLSCIITELNDLLAIVEMIEQYLLSQYSTDGQIIAAKTHFADEQDLTALEKKKKKVLEWAAHSLEKKTLSQEGYEQLLDLFGDKLFTGTTMSLFACDLCGVIDSIEFAYPEQNFALDGPPKPWRCTQCQSKPWHNHFPRLPYKEDMMNIVNRVSKDSPHFGLG